jgi:hypothetical protein
MSELIYFLGAAALFCVLYFVVPRVFGAYLTYSGKRLVTCPETRTPFGVEVDAWHAALTAFRSKGPELRLTSCTRWPEREDCDQDCVFRIRVSPQDCLIKTMLTEWYKGKECAFCHRPFETIHWFDHKPAFLGPKGITIAWQDIRPEDLPEVLDTYKPVCWDCHIIETFRRDFSDVVIDRPEVTGVGARPGPPH